MKKDTWKTIIQVVISVLTAALTALGTTSCMGHGPIYSTDCIGNDIVYGSRTDIHLKKSKPRPSGRGFNCVEPPHARHSSSKLGSVLA